MYTDSNTVVKAIVAVVETINCAIIFYQLVVLIVLDDDVALSASSL